ncbi:hypothetical protein ACIRYZ_33830 [Kitasatospora sp. NPDC101155]|uniref:hypothetical protein n=1 Tax=Kitasatospora sp. NPDC101155 TaxID=3364097 RepID=UPI00382B9BBD
MFTVMLAALCMTLFVAGVCLQVRSTPTVTPASRLTIGIGLLAAGAAFCFRAKTRTQDLYGYQEGCRAAGRGVPGARRWR